MLLVYDEIGYSGVIPIVNYVCDLRKHINNTIIFYQKMNPIPMVVEKVDGVLRLTLPSELKSYTSQDFPPKELEESLSFVEEGQKFIIDGQINSESENYPTILYNLSEGKVSDDWTHIFSTHIPTKIGRFIFGISFIHNLKAETFFLLNTESTGKMVPLLLTYNLSKMLSVPKRSIPSEFGARLTYLLATGIEELDSWGTYKEWIRPDMVAEDSFFFSTIKTKLSPKFTQLAEKFTEEMEKDRKEETFKKDNSNIFIYTPISTFLSVGFQPSEVDTINLILDAASDTLQFTDVIDKIFVSKESALNYWSDEWFGGRGSIPFERTDEEFDVIVYIRTKIGIGSDSVQELRSIFLNSKFVDKVYVNGFLG